MTMCGRIGGLTSLTLFLVTAQGCGGGDPVAVLVEQLEDPSHDVRIAAADGLREIGPPAAVAAPPLLEAIRDPHPTLRQAAARALGAIGDRSAGVMSALRESLLDPELSVRLAAAWALHRLDAEGEHYAPVLQRAMESGEGGTIVAVGNLGANAEWALPTLTRLLKDRRAGVRRLAADALGKIGPDASARTALEQVAARDADDRVREAAGAALKRG